jgi:hypothetical protein
VNYFSVAAVNADGTPNTLNFDHVSDWSFKSLERFFGGMGVVLKKVPGTTYVIDDKPLYYKDEVTGELLPNTGQVI